MKTESTTKTETKSERKLRISLTRQKVLRWHQKRISEKRDREALVNSTRVPSTQEIPQAEQVLSLTNFPEENLTLRTNEDIENLICHRTTLRRSSQTVISALQDERLLLIRRVEQIDATIVLLNQTC